MRKTLVIVALAVVFAILAAPAYAYDEVSSGKSCIECHGVDPVTDHQGPHGGYATTTNKCATCHDVHAAPADLKLLPASTIKGTCETCHDGTSGYGVYGAVFARTGLTPASAHRIDTSSVVPGGDASTGGDASYTFSGQNDYLTCSDCHSPHNANTVDAFTGDRFRSSVATVAIVSNRLLRDRPNGSPYAITKYGSDWCGSCHQGRLTFGSGVNNHPVETTAVAGYYSYDTVARVTTVGVSTVETGTLGGNNRGYVMPAPRDTLQTDHYPVCMQCHEDARNIGDSVFGQIAAGEVFSITATDGATSGNNPRFQTFPHESMNAKLLVETNDDLCTNCHNPINPG